MKTARSIIFYYDDEKKEWLDESGLDLKLSITTGAAYAYTVTDKSDNKLLFNSGGNLVRIEDQNGNALTITYTSGKISSIHDGAGRTVTLSYNSSGLLSTVEDPYQKTKTFTYQGSQLTQITDTDGEVISYIYNGNGMLETVQNIDGYNIHYTYSEVTPHRVEQVEKNSGSTAGQMFSIDRWSNHTTFTDREGRKEIYLFNHTGNTVSVINDKGQAQSSRYLTGGSNSNKISKVSKLQTTAVNFLQNSYLESDTGWNRIQEEASVTLHADAAKALVGTNTFHMVSTKDTGKGGCQQSVNFENGKTYTFSAYVNAPDAVLEQGKCEVQIQATLASGDTIYSEEVDYYKTEDGWYRLITTLSLPETESVSSGKIYAGIRGKADVYFDCFQLEEGKAASRYNLITNGDFRNGTSGYTGTGTNLFDRVRILGEIYDDLDRLVQIRMKDANDQTYVMYRYEYDQEGNLCTEYDVREDLGTETITTRYFYDLSGRLAYCRNDRDEDYRYTYDQNNQVTKIENGNQFRKTETVYTYDKDGREKTAKTATKTRQTAYDTLGRVQSHSWTGTGGTIGQVDYIYDPGVNGSQSNQLQKMTYGSDVISYTYDNNGCT